MASENLKLFYNGKIFTGSSQTESIDTILIENDKIKWLGRKSEGLPLAAKKSVKIDLKGKRVIPAFIDSHMHGLYLARDSKKIACTPPLVNSIKELQQEIKKQANKLEPGQWIEGWGYDESKLAEGRNPTRFDLDQATTEYPVVITRNCTHIAVVNSKALELLEIDETTPEPVGGVIEKNHNGRLTGVFKEIGKDFLFDRLPAKSIEEDASLLADFSEKLFSKGITTITDSLARKYPVDYYQIYQEAIKKGFKQQVILYYKWRDLIHSPELPPAASSPDQQLSIGGVKIIGDGSIAGKTAWLSQPYFGQRSETGIVTTTKAELAAAADFARVNNLQLIVHAMGDKTIDLVIDHFYQEPGWLAEIPSLRIEHLTLPSAEALEKAKEMDIAFNSQPIFIYAEIESYLNNFGQERTLKSYPYRDILNQGHELAFSSDAPATAWSDPANPFYGIESAVTRKAYEGTNTGQDQTLSVGEAIKLYTEVAARITGLKNSGRLAPGHYADFLILDRDIFEIESESIGQTEIEATYYRGEKVYQR
ncbi:MAG: amidohydrolase [Halarsenatibacteraceae bacterium]